MKDYKSQLGILIAAPALLLAAQPVRAATTQIADIQIQSQEGRLELRLKTAGEGESPQVFITQKRDRVVADIANAQLNLSQSNLRQENPVPGIAALEVTQENGNNIRIVVEGEEIAPVGEILQNQGEEIAIGFTPHSGTEAVEAPVRSPQPETSPVATQSQPTLREETESDAASETQSQQPLENIPSGDAIAQVPLNPARQVPTFTGQEEVLFPNPEITIDGNPVAQNQSPGNFSPNPQFQINGTPAAPALPVQPPSTAPPFLPRAVAPPVGDIAISNVSTAPSIIDLGTAARVDSLVLKGAPVREVLGFLARSAGMNLVFVDGGGGEGDGEGQQIASTISLDLENVSIQDVFNSVLQVSGLEANRSRNTIVVGAALPLDARNIISRTLRLNQISSQSAANFLTAQGAELNLPFTQVQIQTFGEGAAARTVQTETPTILSIRAPEDGIAPLVLSGLLVVPEERIDSITLIGPLRKVEMATALLNQLDARKRQVAINVKIVDVNLLNQDNFSSSFSFGINDSFFVVDNGAAAANFGRFNPPTRAQATQPGGINPVVINNPFADSNAFFNFDSPISIPGTIPGIVRVNPGGAQTLQQRGAGTFFNSSAGLSSDPFQAGITDVTLATDTVITVNPDGTSNTALGTIGEVTTALPSLFQFPRQFLSSLQAQIISGNAKILTDPTLVVQEDQVASVNLTQQVFSGFRLQTTGTPPAPVIQTQEPILTEAGLILEIQVTKIDDNGFVTLSVNPTVSSPAGSVPTDQGNITLVQSRSLQSGAIRMRDSQTLIVAGIIQESDRTTVSKVPILGDIPILGALFRSTTRDSQRNEVIVLLTPQILDDSDRYGSWGYNYNPGGATREVLQRQGINVPGNR